MMQSGVTKKNTENTIEIRGFLHLAAVFKERGWPSPAVVAISGELDGQQLLAMLEISAKEVEAVFVNGKAYPVKNAQIRPGDRVALVPPGTPGPYRVFLGFVDL